MDIFMEKKHDCFVIAPIGPDNSDIRKRSDQILKHVINPAASACGFATVRADNISEPGMITAQIIQHIIDDPLVIADLTGSNPNVFYELAVRHAIRKPLVQLIQKDEKIPFDVAGMRTVPVDHRDLDSVQEAKVEIERQIRSAMSKKPGEIDSPISASIELQALRKSDKPEERSIAELISVMADLKSDIASVNKRLSAQDDAINVRNAEMIAELVARRTVHDRREREMVLEELRYRIDKSFGGFEAGKALSKDQVTELKRVRELLSRAL
jgi:hypothetical protein